MNKRNANFLIDKKNKSMSKTKSKLKAKRNKKCESE